MNIEEIIEFLTTNAVNYAAVYGVKIILAIVIFFVGKWLVKTITNLLKRTLTARNLDATLTSFITNIIYYLAMVVVIIAVLGQVGIQTASLVAVIGAAGLAVGLALQGSLSNFAAGVMIILFRPCRVGDFVEAGGTMGSIKEIGIFATTMLTPDNKTIIVPNSSIMGGNITNFSTQSERRVDLVIGVSYNADIKKVKEVLAAVVAADERVVKEKDVTIGLLELADSSVNFVVRPWVKTADYWPTYFDLMENIKLRLDAEGIEIPFPQMDVHLSKEG
ncbi:mechanosensitive ion channel family protein [Halioxenophilus sp. WMMB6]|uniref:mechanosensitive ion channel family protein n=1 Tax=Halioxenophilus sp. WMMB6 TaxID=3073815 RepID=UPI00295EB726|nr:mechanosensitive ion channel domain-containing protein [Halioxenophilus sp. WMMB6]